MGANRPRCGEWRRNGVQSRPENVSGLVSAVDGIPAAGHPLAAASLLITRKSVCAVTAANIFAMKALEPIQQILDTATDYEKIVNKQG
jgi:hypothetical protein